MKLSRPSIMSIYRAASLGALFAAAAVVSMPAAAETLLVGDGHKLKMPSEAAAVVKDGDTVQIEPHEGGYFDCAVWRQNNLTIEGKGQNVVITDKACAGKALFVIDGNNVTIRNLTFQRARVPDKNGAGIRAEGGNLRIEHSRFVNNENGILSASNPKATLAIYDSEFIDNGKCDPVCAHGIYINQFAVLHIEHTTFRRTKQGHHIKSRALRTELIGNDVADGPDGTSSYLIDIPSGGGLVMRDNVLEKGPKSDNHSTAVSIGEEGVTQATPEITIANNQFTNDMSAQTIFVRNGTATPAMLSGNRFVGKIIPLSGDGSSR
jgi:hypothetical protein